MALIALAACSEPTPAEAPPPAPAPTPVAAPEPPPPPEPLLLVRYTGAAARRLSQPANSAPDGGPAAPDGGPGARDTGPVPDDTVVELPPRSPRRQNAERPAAGSGSWLLPETPSVILWRHPAPAAGLRVSLVDDGGVAWPTRSTTREQGDWREVTLEPLTPLPEGRSFQVVAELPGSPAASLWREAISVETGATEPPPWRDRPRKRRGGRRRR